MPHLNYMLLAWGTKCHKIELLQKRAVRLVYFKAPVAHTKSLFKRIKQPILSDLYTLSTSEIILQIIQKQITILFRSVFTRIRSSSSQFKK